MASPEQVTMHNVSGNWHLNRELSENIAEALVIQGVPFLIRKLMLMANISETVAETTRADGTKGLIVTKAAVGLKGQADLFDGSGEERTVDGGYFAPTVRVRSWWVDLSSNAAPRQPNGEPLDSYLLEGWNVEEQRGVAGHFAGLGINEKSGVKDNMMWGFCQIGGKRYRVVKYYMCKGEQEVRARLVYDWVGK